jgi:plasmid maintenance system antidote protein VapI
MNIGKSLKIALTRHGKTQREMSHDLGVSHVVLNRHFNNARTLTPVTIQQYADYFGLKPSELIALGE